jgi:hypothetical protein
VPSPTKIAALVENAMGRIWPLPLLLLLLQLAPASLVAQSGPPSEIAKVHSEQFQTRIAVRARELINHPRLRGLSAQQREERVEFVVGNMLFVATHELGHAAISELDLPVLGPEEDTADYFSTLTALNVLATEFSQRALVGAAQAWFLMAQRDKKYGTMPEYYGRHDLSEQRAYRIICLMVGSDLLRFKALADQMKLPETRRTSCSWDFESATRSWQRVLAPHYRKPEQPKTHIQVIYGAAEGELGILAQTFREIRFLEALAEYAADRYVWPAPFLMEMRTCGGSGARWTIPTRKLHLCYELADEFAQLNRDFGQASVLRRARQR